MEIVDGKTDGGSPREYEERLQNMQEILFPVNAIGMRERVIRAVALSAGGPVPVVS
jgi:hypothetical protein